MSQAYEFAHEPVMINECLEALRIRGEGTYMDVTAGGGGHSALIAEKLGENGVLLSLDKDMSAIEACQKKRASISTKGRWLIEKEDFADAHKIVQTHCPDGVDGILADFGVSSYQLDDNTRGFSYMNDGPLDMRMDQQQRLDAAYVVNHYPYESLIDIFQKYGEEKYAGSIARAICQYRRKATIDSTKALCDIIFSAVPAKARREAQHPAKRVFQAIRIEVNRELSAIESFLAALPVMTRPYARMAIISFHSLEDRLVKEAFRRMQEPCTCPKKFPVCICEKKSLGTIVTKKLILPSEAEVIANPRSRSAKLRVFERNDVI